MAEVKRVTESGQRSGYSEEELRGIYSLARLFIETGELKRAEVILHGLNEIAPAFVPAWLGMGYLKAINSEFDAAIKASGEALRLAPENAEAMLMLASCFLSTGDFNQAGTFLGEVNERIETGRVSSPYLVRFYRTQLVRYQNR